MAGAGDVGVDGRISMEVSRSFAAVRLEVDSQFLEYHFKVQRSETDVRRREMDRRSFQKYLYIRYNHNHLSFLFCD